jgi:hypothetical protein
VSRAQAESNKNTSKFGHAGRSKKDGNRTGQTPNIPIPSPKRTLSLVPPPEAECEIANRDPIRGASKNDSPGRKQQRSLKPAYSICKNAQSTCLTMLPPTLCTKSEPTVCAFLRCPVVQAATVQKMWVQFRRERESRSITDREKVPAASLICNPQDTYVQPKVVLLALLHYAALCCRTMRCFIAPTITAGPAPPIGTLDSIGPLLDPGPARQEASLGHVADLACIGTVRPFDTCLSGHRP